MCVHNVWKGIMCTISDLLVFDLGSRGPSTVTLIALLYDATCGGLVDTVIVNVKLLPAMKENRKMWLSFDYYFCCVDQCRRLQRHNISQSQSTIRQFKNYNNTGKSQIPLLLYGIRNASVILHFIITLYCVIHPLSMVHPITSNQTDTFTKQLYCLYRDYNKPKIYPPPVMISIIIWFVSCITILWYWFWIFSLLFCDLCVCVCMFVLGWLFFTWF